MKTNTTKTLALLLISFAVFSCTTSQKVEESSAESSEAMEVQSKITLTKAPPSPEYPDAVLTKNSVSVVENDSMFTVDYGFDVTNYELGMQTEDAGSRGIANSGKGQHIHFIVNNGPYSAHYMPGVNNQLNEGKYVVLAFLSRSYHESVKSEGAYHIENLNVGNADGEDADLEAPHLFYSRPKGTYKGADTKKVMLDFYLLNTSISPDGNKVRATINGNEFIIDEWAPYYIEGLPLGNVAIKLELLDADGNAVPGPFNSVERSVTLGE
ncbi:MAG: phosphopeptide-binding protein [Ekhidna sp.]